MDRKIRSTIDGVLSKLGIDQASPRAGAEILKALDQAGFKIVKKDEQK